MGTEHGGAREQGLSWTLVSQSGQEGLCLGPGGQGMGGELCSGGSAGRPGHVPPHALQCPGSRAGLARPGPERTCSHQREQPTGPGPPGGRANCLLCRWGPGDLVQGVHTHTHVRMCAHVCACMGACALCVVARWSLCSCLVCPVVAMCHLGFVCSLPDPQTAAHGWPGSPCTLRGLSWQGGCRRPWALARPGLRVRAGVP